MDSGSAQTGGRLVHLDRLRTFGVLAIIATHPMAASMEHARGWYVRDARTWFVFDGAGMVAEAALVPLLFFVAGWATPAALVRRDVGEFLRGRALRLLLPVPLFLATVVAFAEWLRAQRGGPVGFLESWGAHWRWDLNHGHLWFLPYLFVLSGAAAAAKALRPRAFDAALASPACGPRWAGLAAFAVAVGLSKAALVATWGDQVWFDSALLNVQVARVPFNVGFFLLGLAAAFGRWHERPVARRVLRLVALSVAATAAFLVAGALGRPPIADGLLQAGAVLALVLLAEDLARRRPDRRTRIGRSLEESSYGMYLLHYAPVLGFGFLVRNADLHPAPKWAAVATASLATCWGASLAAGWLLRRGRRALKRPGYVSEGR